MTHTNEIDGYEGLNGALVDIAGPDDDLSDGDDVEDQVEDGDDADGVTGHRLRGVVEVAAAGVRQPGQARHGHLVRS